MKLIYTSENRFLVGNAKNIVENAGIEVILKNQYISGGVGELSPLDTWPELWVVHDSDYEKASRLLEDTLNPGDTKEWRCGHCGEINAGSFEYCWKCRTER